MIMISNNMQTSTPFCAQAKARPVLAHRFYTKVKMPTVHGPHDGQHVHSIRVPVTSTSGIFCSCVAPSHAKSSIEPVKLDIPANRNTCKLVN
mmetsp:Transcript_23189/g.34349  ORF Transcript_23189/g.34349 Transcript_23189/m.34349 type:complete len:92 (+) Transcript_23189:2002-2277(+)